MVNGISQQLYDDIQDKLIKWDKRWGSLLKSIRDTFKLEAGDEVELIDKEHFFYNSEGIMWLELLRKDIRKNNNNSINIMSNYEYDA